MTSKNVFISMGRQYRRRDRTFLDALEKLVRESNAVPMMVKYDSAPLGALAKTEKVMRQCEGAIIVAHERIFIKSGEEMAFKTPLSEVRFSTPWNQVEGAMARALRMKILVLLESTVERAGIFEAEEGESLLIKRVEITPKALTELQGTISNWCRSLSSTREPLPDRIGGEHTNIAELFEIAKRLTLTTWGVLGVFLLGVFLAGWGMNYSLCNWGYKRACIGPAISTPADKSSQEPRALDMPSPA